MNSNGTQAWFSVEDLGGVHAMRRATEASLRIVGAWILAAVLAGCAAGSGSGSDSASGADPAPVPPPTKQGPGTVRTIRPSIEHAAALPLLSPAQAKGMTSLPWNLVQARDGQIVLYVQAGGCSRPVGSQVRETTTTVTLAILAPLPLPRAPCARRSGST
jgi:hypothetical protein